MWINDNEQKERLIDTFLLTWAKDLERKKRKRRQPEKKKRRKLTAVKQKQGDIFAQQPALVGLYYCQLEAIGCLTLPPRDPAENCAAIWQIQQHFFAETGIVFSSPSANNYSPRPMLRERFLVDNVNYCRKCPEVRGQMNQPETMSKPQFRSSFIL